MRRTMTLDSDVAKLLHDEQQRTNKSCKEAIKSAVQFSLQSTPTKHPKLLPVRAMGLRTGMDRKDIAGLSDDLEAEIYLRATARRRR